MEERISVFRQAAYSLKVMKRSSGRGEKVRAAASSAGAADAAFELHEDFGKGQHPDADGDERDAPLKLHDAEGQAGQGGNGLDAHRADKHPGGGRDEPPGDGFGTEPGDDGHGHADEREDFRRPHVQGYGGQRRGHEDQHEGGEGVARHRGVESHAQGLFPLALRGERVAVPRGGRGLGRSGGVQQHARDRAAEKGTLVQPHQKADGGDGGHVIGKRDAQGNGHRAVDARDGARDHPRDHAEQHEEHVGDLERLAQSGKNHIKHLFLRRSGHGHAKPETHDGVDRQHRERGHQREGQRAALAAEILDDGHESHTSRDEADP